MGPGRTFQAGAAICTIDQNIRELIHLEALQALLGRWPGTGVYREGLTDLGLRLRAVESHSGVQSEGSDVADVHFEMVTQAALWRIGGEEGPAAGWETSSETAGVALGET